MLKITMSQYHNKINNHGSSKANELNTLSHELTLSMVTRWLEVAAQLSAELSTSGTWEKNAPQACVRILQ